MNFRIFSIAIIFFSFFNFTPLEKNIQIIIIYIIFTNFSNGVYQISFKTTTNQSCSFTAGLFCFQIVKDLSVKTLFFYCQGGRIPRPSGAGMNRPKYNINSLTIDRIPRRLRRGGCHFSIVSK